MNKCEKILFLEVNLEWMEEVCPMVDSVVATLSCLPDFSDDVKVICLKGMAQELRKCAKQMDKAVREAEVR